VWCGYRCKEEVAKLIMIFWCLFAFISSGFEHSIANMTLLAIGLLAPGTAAVSLAGYAFNLLAVTLGNMVGAIVFLAIPYHLISNEEIEFAEKSHYSFKEALTPISETLFYFTEDQTSVPKEPARGVAIFLRSCDVHSLHCLRPVQFRLPDLHLFHHAGYLLRGKRPDG
jgi:hypothetical protein